MDEEKTPITPENITLETLSEYVHLKVGESSTLFFSKDDGIFNESRALEIAAEMIKAITNLVNDNVRTAPEIAKDLLGAHLEVVRAHLPQGYFEAIEFEQMNANQYTDPTKDHDKISLIIDFKKERSYGKA